jgi:hypothetical protein
MCLNSRQLPVDDSVVTAAASNLVQILNDILTYNDPHGLCARLRLHAVHGADSLQAVHEADRLAVREEDRTHGVFSFQADHGVFSSQDVVSSQSDVIVQLTVETTPGGALFEATLRRHSDAHPFTLVGDVSRINKYGIQSECVDVGDIKKICYCKKFVQKFE